MIEISNEEVWLPLSHFGLTHPFFSVNKHVLIYTWYVLFFMLIISVVARIVISFYPNSLFCHIIKKYVQTFLNLIKQSIHNDVAHHTLFVLTLFTFLLICNCIIIIPTFEEPTKDLNTTFALSIISFLYIQFYAIRTHGLIVYLNEYFKTPFSLRPSCVQFSLKDMGIWCIKVLLNIIIGCLTFPVELLSKASTILSLSFRLFGNIFGGSVITSLWMNFKSGSFILQILGIITGFNLFLLIFFGVFEGMVQAFVFTTLTVTYLSMALQTHSE